MTKKRKLDTLTETLSIDEALRKGRRMIIYPITAFIITVFPADIAAFSLLHIPGEMLLVLLGVSLFLVWFYWAVATVRWRIWAFTNVRNVHELQKLAISQGLMVADDSFLGYTQIKSAYQEQQLGDILKKFKIPDVFIDDVNVPAETAIFYSKGKNMILIVLLAAVLLAGLFLICKQSDYIIRIGGFFLIALAIILGYFEVLMITSKKPQILLNDKGIETPSAGFFGWKEIRNAGVTLEGSGKSRDYYLVYHHPGGEERKRITFLGVTHHALENFLRVYRARWEHQRTGH